VQERSEPTAAHDDDDHEHDHHHGSAAPHEHHHEGGRLRLLGEVLVPHSHDAADSIDTALESNARGIRAVRNSFVVLLVTAVLQAVVVAATGSVALLADTIHNFSDATTAIPLFVAFRLADRPPTRRYTYGYRRAEDLAGLFVLVMIAVSSVVAAWEAVHRLVDPRPLEHLAVLAVAGVVGFIGNELVALYRIREGNAIGSAALVADGHHARTDGLTSLAVVAGAVGAWAGFERADAFAGLVISVAIFLVLVGAARQVYHRLMDAVDPSIVDAIAHEVGHSPGVLGAEEPRVRWLGHRLVAEVTIDVDAAGTVAQGHEIATAARQHLLDRVAHLDDVQVHVHPRGR
jgi:cation diffusion facilitator family transporter